MNLRRGIIAGLAWGLAGILCAALGVAALTFDRNIELAANLSWWRLHLYPGIVFIPMYLFFTGLVTYTPTQYVSFAKTLALVIVASIPLSMLLNLFFRLLGLLPQHYYKGQDPPYLAQILVILLPMIAVSSVLIYYRSSSDKLLITDD